MAATEKAKKTKENQASSAETQVLWTATYIEKTLHYQYRLLRIKLRDYGKTEKFPLNKYNRINSLKPSHNVIMFKAEWGGFA